MVSHTFLGVFRLSHYNSGTWTIHSCLVLFCGACNGGKHGGTPRMDLCTVKLSTGKLRFFSFHSLASKPWWCSTIDDHSYSSLQANTLQPIGYVNELLYGLMVNSITGFKNPSGGSTYSVIAGDAWYRAQLNLQDMKIGHYMHIPPKAVFFSQVFGSIIGTPINYAVMRWVLNTKFDMISGKVQDPAHQWTGQVIASTFTVGVQYVLIVREAFPPQHSDANIFRALNVSSRCQSIALYCTASFLVQSRPSSFSYYTRNFPCEVSSVEHHDLLLYCGTVVWQYQHWQYI